MLIKKLALTAALATLSCVSYAGVAEKKATRAAEENVAEAVASVKESCGNAKLDVTMDWAALDGVAAKSAKFMTDKKVEMAYLINDLGNRTVATLESLQDICEDDADYKEEIAKIEALDMKTKPEVEDFKSEFSLDGTTLVAHHGFYMTRTSNDFTTRLKALY